MHVVDQVGRKKLTNGRRTPTDADIQAASGLASDFERLGRAGVNEVERRPFISIEGLG
jgi:hypothetical protein